MIKMIGNSITIAWLSGGQIAQITLPDNSRYSISEWLKTLQSLYQQWYSNDPFLILADLRTLSIDNKGIVENLSSQLPPDTMGRIACLISLTDVKGKSVRRGLEVQTFDTQEAALAWLQ
jgi:hypothetical protein